MKKTANLGLKKQVTKLLNDLWKKENEEHTDPTVNVSKYYNY